MTEERTLVTTPGDQAARDAALGVEHSFIVQAPAGSGKTELLTQRFLRLLSLVDRPERILAITFTRKATQEMRHRIISRLRQAQSPLTVAPHERQAVDIAAAVLAQNQRLQWGLLDNPGRLRIVTIDALCTQLLVRDPQSGAMVNQLQVLEDARPIYRLAVRRMVEDLESGDSPGAVDASRLQKCLVRVLVHLDGDMLRLEELFIHMMAIRDQWTGSMAQPFEAVERVLRHRQEVEKSVFEAALGRQPLERALELAAGMGEHFEDSDHAAWRLTAACKQPPAGTEGLLWRYYWLAQILTTDANVARGPGGLTAKRLLPGLEEKVGPLVSELQAIYRQWHGQPAAVLAIERMAKSAPLDEESLVDGLLQDILDLLRFLLAELNLTILTEGKTDFQFLAERALYSLCGDPGGETAYSDVLLAEDYRLSHMLVDEFQDTSHTQHALLAQLTAGWTDGDGRTLFLVGDPMQSIYRFREADVGLFTRVAQQGRLGGVLLKTLKLSANFRSRSEIVAWINQQFPQIFPPQDDFDSGAVRYSPAVAERGAGGAVEVHALTPDETIGDEARLIARLIRTCQEQDRDTEIAVLVRARKHLTALARELVHAEIEFEAVKVDPLVSRPVIQDLMAIARAISHPADRIAAAALLRAPWCGLRLAELHRVMGEHSEAVTWTAISRGQQDPELPEAVRRRLARLNSVMDVAFRLRGEMGLGPIVEFAWLQLGGPYVYADSSELDNAAQFFDLLRRVERERQTELIERLAEALDLLYARERPAKVQLMTIHQAKGLEFDVVILPQLHRSGRKREPSLIMAQQFALNCADAAASPPDASGLLMAAIPARGQHGPSAYRYLNMVDAERENHELSRMLYVATTRARKQLHLFGRLNYRPKSGCHAQAGSFLKMLMPAFEPAFDERGYEQVDSPQSETEPATLPMLHLSGAPEIELEMPETQERRLGQAPSLPDRDAVALGEALHIWLELIHDHQGEDRNGAWFDEHQDMLRSLLRRTGADPGGIEKLLPRLQWMIGKSFEHGVGRSAVSPAGTMESHAELPVFRREGSRIAKRIIDRLYRDRSGSWHIVDYKTGGEQLDRWKRQLDEYAELVRALTGSEMPDCRVYQADSCRMIDV